VSLHLMHKFGTNYSHNAHASSEGANTIYNSNELNIAWFAMHPDSQGCGP
jgi:hypothetical protein